MVKGEADFFFKYESMRDSLQETPKGMNEPNDSKFMDYIQLHSSSSLIFGTSYEERTDFPFNSHLLQLDDGRNSLHFFRHERF